MIDKKELESLIFRLENFNRWRRGGDGDMPAPLEIGVDIDSAIIILKENLKNKGE